MPGFVIRNVTTPAGTATPETDSVTVAVKVTTCVGCAGFRLDVSAVVVAVAVITCCIGALTPERYEASPL